MLELIFPTHVKSCCICKAGAAGDWCYTGLTPTRSWVWMGYFPLVRTGSIFCL